MQKPGVYLVETGKKVCSDQKRVEITYEKEGKMNILQAGLIKKAKHIHLAYCCEKELSGKQVPPASCKKEISACILYPGWLPWQQTVLTQLYESGIFTGHLYISPIQTILKELNYQIVK